MLKNYWFKNLFFFLNFNLILIFFTLIEIIGHQIKVVSEMIKSNNLIKL